MMTKIKIRRYWEKYVFNCGRYGARRLNNVYGKPSAVKKNAWERIKTEYYINEGFKLSIITYNMWYYTVGYMYKNGDKFIFRVHTPTNTGEMEIGPNEKLMLNSIKC